MILYSLALRLAIETLNDQGDMSNPHPVVQPLNTGFKVNTNERGVYVFPSSEQRCPYTFLGKLHYINYGIIVGSV